MTGSTRTYELCFFPLEVGPDATAHFEVELQEGVAFRPQKFVLREGVNIAAFRIMGIRIDRHPQFTEHEYQLDPAARVPAAGVPAACFGPSAVGEYGWDTLPRTGRIEAVVWNTSEQPEVFDATFTGVLREE